jgi:GH25 family lysozyme M1 (1,4-beta-N-acetylmuramidase)
MVPSGLPGVDVSYYQGVIDWPRVFDAGFRFACCKSTEATRGYDPTFERNRKQARDAGLITGAYHFCRPDMDAGDAEDEAKNFFRVVGKLEPDELPPSVDIEIGHASMRGADVLRWTNDFIQAVEGFFGRHCIVYAYPYFWPGLGVVPSGFTAARPLWLAHYTTGRPLVPAPWKGYTFWQYSGDHGVKVPGVGPACDRNVFAVDSVQALRDFVELSKPWRAEDVRKPDAPEWQPKDLAAVWHDITGNHWDSYTDTETGLCHSEWSLAELWACEPSEFQSAQKRMFEVAS